MAVEEGVGQVRGEQRVVEAALAPRSATRRCCGRPSPGSAGPCAPRVRDRSRSRALRPRRAIRPASAASPPNQAAAACATRCAARSRSDAGRERGERGPRRVRVAAGELRPGLADPERHALRAGSRCGFGICRGGAPVAGRHQQVGARREQVGALGHRAPLELELNGRERLLERGAARDAGVERERLDAGSSPSARERGAQPLEGAQRAGPVARREPSAHHGALGRLVGGSAAATLFPAAGRAERVEVTRAEPSSRLLGPGGIGVVGKQFAAVERRGRPTPRTARRRSRLERSGASITSPPRRTSPSGSPSARRA